ncbi:TPA: hypothetical protein WI610_000271 [Neisseria meningitidis]|uniref:Periplasmic protein n=3 Tax=Neisseria meningitidis TaxID=487 RepID=Q9JXE0_NEIMB|nr:hypothetical protein [Neisseria meningitidis]AJC63235.1 hypothetical protein N875_06235 [Neisseria meningitidis LNP21362]AAF42409.1 hypothetical protein NMB2092 [Neisseria meningitidis MC58]ADY96592.1 conserved hypothetical protein [Neisseria meningitidis H44/76]ARC06840.1 hypothetical protein A6J49_00520 [Neisseria meningitidis]EFV62962.1 periplasmic protein [Neisseria meningitidis H44/76]
MPSEPPSDGIARHPKSTIKMAKKPNKPFRLTPKLLIRAVLLICIAAIGALAIGIVSTFNPNGDKTLQAEPQHTDSPRETEFWLPNGVVGQDAAQPEHHHAASSEPAQPDGTDESGSGLPSPAAPKKNRVKPQPADTAQTDRQPDDAGTQAENTLKETPVLPTNVPRPEPRKETPEKQAQPKETPKENHTKPDTPKNTPPKPHKEILDNLF